MFARNAVLAFFFGLFAMTAAFDPTCRGKAVYKIFFKNLLTPKNFGNLIPPNGLTFSPLAGVSHSNRISFFTIRGFASRAVEQIAKTGVNDKFIKLAKLLAIKKRGVLSVFDAGKPTQPGKVVFVKLVVDCKHPFVTVLGMIAPSPDWIVQINNRNLYDSKKKKFIRSVSANLIAYDTGLDDGREFTPPLDLSLDLPTVPQKNISPLVEDETDRFEGRVVGKVVIKRIG